MLIPNYSTCIVHGDTILDIKVYFHDDRETTFFIKLNYDGDDDGICKDFDMDVFFPSWRHRLSNMISEILCSERRMVEIRKWEETMYYHFDSIIRRLRLPNSREYRFGATFDVHFIQASEEALEELDMTTFAIGNNRTLLKRVKYDGSMTDDDCAICFENFRDGEHFTCMPCSHYFHYSCLSMWLPTHQSCPMCRFVLNWNTMDDLPLN